MTSSDLRRTLAGELHLQRFFRECRAFRCLAAGTIVQIVGAFSIGANVAHGLGILVTVVAAAWLGRHAVGAALRGRLSWPRALALGIAVGIAIIALDIANGAIADRLGLSKLSDIDGAPPALVALLAPVGETFAFQGWLQTTLLRVEPRLALPITILVFTSIHFPTGASIVYYVLVSIALSLLQFRTKSLLATATAHLTVNGSILAVQLFAR